MNSAETPSGPAYARIVAFQLPDGYSIDRPMDQTIQLAMEQDPSCRKECFVSSLPFLIGR